MKPLIIGVLIVIAGLATWRIVAGRVDRTKPEAVAKAFIVALKNHDVDKAGSYWVPDGAEAWREDATRKIANMRGGTFERFFDDLADGSTAFALDTKTPMTGDSEQRMVSGNTAIDVRRIDGKWYVCKGPI